MVSKRIEIRVLPGDRSVLWIQRHGPVQVGNRFSRFLPLRMRDGEHVECVIVIRVFVAYESQLRERLVVPAAVDRQGCCVEAFLDRHRYSLLRRRVSLADVQIEPHPLVQFLLFRVEAEDRIQLINGHPVVVSLQGFQTPFVKGDRFEVR